MITIEQTVEIPASRRLVIDVPREVPIGRARLELNVTPEPADAAGNETAFPGREYRAAIENCCGLGKRMGSRLTTERLLERRREDRAFDEAQYRRSVCEQRKND